MHKLPVEVLQQIFFFLHQHEKIECMLTCRHWANVIFTFSLFNTIHLTKMSNLQRLIEKVQREPFRGAEVERLILDLNLDRNFNLNLISILFPNLRLCFLRQAEHKLILKTKKGIPANVQLQQKNIEYITESRSHMLAYNILSSTLCTRLKSLSVNACDQDHLGKTLISLLVNAPNLKKLSMAAMHISFNDLELIHTTLPFLNSIQFPYAKLVADIVIPTYIQPINSVTIFSMVTCRASTKTQIKWLRYIHKKYVRLTEWEFRCINDPLDGQRDVERVDKEGLIPLVQSFGSRLKTLSIALKDYGPDFFQSMDNANCQIQNLSLSVCLQSSILDSLVKSSQVEHIQILKIQVSELGNYERLRQLVVLKELELDCKFRFDTDRKTTIKESVLLHKLLDVCSNTLESLRVMNASLNMGGSFTHDDKQFPSIKRLGFFSVPLDKYMDRFISRCFPQLQMLTLEFCGLSGKKFDLTDHHLSFVEIAEGTLFKDTHLLMMTNKENRWYTAKRCLFNYVEFKDHFSIHDTQVYRATTKMIPSDNPYNNNGRAIFETKPTVTFKCASVKTLLILGY